MNASAIQKTCNRIISHSECTSSGASIAYTYTDDRLTFVSANDTLLFSYDAAGNVVAVEVQSDSWLIDGETLYYIRNGQGDITGPVNRSDPSGCVSKKDRLLTESDKLYGDPQEQSETASLPILSGGVIVGSASHDANRRPNTGRPGSTFEAPNGDKRTYGSDGKPIHDYDHDDHNDPK